MFESIGWQVVQLGVQPHSVVKVDDEVSHVMDGFAVVGAALLPDPLHLQIQEKRSITE